MKVTDILWDVDFEEDRSSLPTEIELPDGIDSDDFDAIDNYLSDTTGFCHLSYTVVKEDKEERNIFDNNLLNYYHEIMVDGRVRLMGHIGFDFEVSKEEAQKLFKFNPCERGVLVESWMKKGYAVPTKMGDSYFTDKNGDLGDRIYFNTDLMSFTGYEKKSSQVSSKNTTDKKLEYDETFDVLNKLVSIEECDFEGIAECVFEAINEEDNYFRDMGKSIYQIISDSKGNAEMRKGIDKAFIAITGYSLSTLTERLKECFADELAALDDKTNIKTGLDEQIIDVGKNSSFSEKGNANSRNLEQHEKYKI